MYVKSNASLLADVFEYFRNMRLEINEHDLACFPTSPKLTWGATPNEAKVKVDLLTNIDMFLMIKKVSEVDCFMLFIDMQKLITSTLKFMIKIKNNCILRLRRK